jgi:hypothetical protein
LEIGGCSIRIAAEEFRLKHQISSPRPDFPLFFLKNKARGALIHHNPPGCFSPFEFIF